MLDIYIRIDDCGHALFKWGEGLRKKFRVKIDRFRNHIHMLQRYRDAARQEMVMEAKRKLSLLLKQITEFWKQRSKLFWLKASDVNSKRFHLYTSAKNRKNTITKLSDDLGNCCT